MLSEGLSASTWRHYTAVQNDQLIIWRRPRAHTSHISISSCARANDIRLQNENTIISQSSLLNFSRPAKTGNEAPAIEGDRTDSEGEKEEENDESACTDYEAKTTKRHVSCLIFFGGGEPILER